MVKSHVLFHFPQFSRKYPRKYRGKISMQVSNLYSITKSFVLDLSDANSFVQHCAVLVVHTCLSWSVCRTLFLRSVLSTDSSDSCLILTVSILICYMFFSHRVTYVSSGALCAGPCMFMVNCLVNYHN